MQNLFVNDVGDKFPLVMVHGFLGSSIMWEPQIQDLKDNRDIYTFYIFISFDTLYSFALD